MKCSICKKEIDYFEYAIRDTKPEEHPFEWFWRHFVCMLTLGYLKRLHYKVTYPVCNDCIEDLNREVIY